MQTSEQPVLRFSFLHPILLFFMNCIHCGSEIPEARLKAIPTTKTCIDCSKTNRVYGFAVISGKTTYSEIQIVTEETAQDLYTQQDRKGGVATGVQFKNQQPPKLSNFDFE
ncbi:TraR/DksA C4-type zinc finger protein [Cytophagaceae bacterium DM2B3-1]|uniref:TraR/DksA C4-type zinc finger protein n=2 Tax=Xanthocytophaga flava TaxID=3048013 RepID=A0ABT7CSP3_9BACT|nr:TraR/DksA C4-type zinc finger protein [Xanthocytophaga flavus]MDJ1496720.1 TraR/DksA C4-type zinc finger protein [Xanthocytophaga flavus]